jgi:hypothetical protein
VRRVRLLEPHDLVVRQLQLLRRECVLEVPELRRADDRCGYARLVQQPRECNLRGRHAAGGSYFDGAVDDREVELRHVERVRELVGLRARRQLVTGRSAVSREQSARERAPRQNTDALVDALRDHLPLLFAIDEVVVVLHRHEPRARDALRLRELPRPHAARADVPRLAGAHDVVQRVHRLLDRCARIEAMDLVQVDVVEPEPFE